MSEIVRFGISLDKGLLEKFDSKIADEGYENRSEAIRDLIRNSFVEEKWESDSIVVGGISMIYDHHHRELLMKIMDIEHDSHDLILSTQHVHLAHTGCLELLIVKGEAWKIKSLYDSLKSIKGVAHVGMTKSGMPEELI